MHTDLANSDLLSKLNAVVSIGYFGEYVTEYDIADLATSDLITGDGIRRRAFYHLLPRQGAKLISRALSIINEEIRAGHTNGAWTGASSRLRALKTAQWGVEQALSAAR